MNKKTKSSIILSSLCAIGVAGSLIAGATYALFTSESKTNIAVTSGKVKVEASLEKVEVYSPTLISADGLSIVNKDNAATENTFYNGGTATFTDSSLTLDKMTPGDKVTFKINVTNLSNVKTKYKTKLSLLDGDEILFNMLSLKDTSDTRDYEICSFETDWKDLDIPEDESGSVVSSTEYSLELPIEAGNIFQGRNCTIGFSVEAIQANASTTAFYEVDDQTDFLTAIGDSGDKYIALTTSEETLKLTGGDAGELFVKGNNVVVDLNGKTLEIPQCFTFSESTAKDVTFKNGTIISNFAWEWYNILAWDGPGSNLTLDGITLKFADDISTNWPVISTNDADVEHLNFYNSTIIGGVNVGYGAVNINIKNSTFKDNRLINNLALLSISNNSKGDTINIYSGEFDATDATYNRNIFDISASGANINIYGGTFNVSENKGVIFNTLATAPALTSYANVYGGTFNGKLMKEYANSEALFHNVIAKDKVSLDYTEKYLIKTIDFGYQIYKEKVDN